MPSSTRHSVLVFIDILALREEKNLEPARICNCMHQAPCIVWMIEIDSASHLQSIRSRMQLQSTFLIEPSSCGIHWGKSKIYSVDTFLGTSFLQNDGHDKRTKKSHLGGVG